MFGYVIVWGAWSRVMTVSEMQMAALVTVNCRPDPLPRCDK